MSRETIMKIRETEEQADRLIETAEADAAAMRADAEAQGKELCRQTEESVSEELDGMLEQIRVKADELTERMLAEAAEEAESIAEQAKLKRKSAEKIVIRGLDAKCR